MSVFHYIAIFLTAIAIFFIARWHYQRNVNIKKRMQLDQVFTNISHELLTPLTVIGASIERLRDQEPRYAKDYALMELNVERMTRLLQQILETSKSQSGELKLKVAQGDVMEYIRQTALCIEPLMHKKGLAFSIQCTPKSMMGWIDTDKLDKIIYNLLSNAAKYTRTPGMVQLKVRTNEYFDQIIIQVIDNGIGIPADRMKQLFKRYYDGDYRWMKVHGTGLGLALTRDLVYLHNGTITCQSDQTIGTTFTVTLPIKKEAFAPSQIDDQHQIDFAKPNNNIIDLSSLEQPDTTEEHQEVDRSHFYRILLVEDNEELLMLMETLLSNHFNILKATNGAAALDIISKEPIDLIVSDVSMPEMDGNELTRQIKTTPEWSHLPIILISAKAHEEDRKASMLLGADDYVTKPFRLGDLELRINNIIENRIRIVGERAAVAATEEEPRPATPDEEFLQRANACVHKHLDDSDFDRDAFASEMGASQSTLYNKLRALTGLNVTAYIRDIRMKEAKRMAETQSDLRVSDLAYKVGFKDPKYFATCFRKEFGIQPSEYIEQHNK